MEKCAFCGHAMVDGQVTVAFPNGSVAEFTQKECSNDSCDYAYIPAKEDLKIRVKQLEAEVETWKSRATINSECGLKFQEERDAARAQAEELADCLSYCHDEFVDHLNRGSSCSQCKIRVEVAQDALRIYRKARG